MKIILWRSSMIRCDPYLLPWCRRRSPFLSTTFCATAIPFFDCCVMCSLVATGQRSGSNHSHISRFVWLLSCLFYFFSGGGGFRDLYMLYTLYCMALKNQAYYFVHVALPLLRLWMGPCHWNACSSGMNLKTDRLGIGMLGISHAL